MNVVLISTYELGRQPFGLASPAAWLKRAGANVTCFDLAISHLDDAAIESTDFVAIYVPMHTATRLALSVGERVTQVNPSAHLCFFGLYAPMNEKGLRASGADSIIGGEFESQLVALYHRLEEARTTMARQRVEGERVARNIPASNKSTKFRQDATVSLERQEFLVPDRSGLPAASEYARLISDGASRLTGSTEASRGCKHLCRHCPIVPVYNGRFRIVQKEIVLADIRQQVERGSQHITFGDPDFFNGPTHALAIVHAVHQEFPDVTYDVTIKVEHLLKHADALPVLRDTGCAFVTSAVEAVDNSILRIFEKHHTREDFTRVVELFHSLGMVLQPTFVAFNPWISLEGYRELLKVVAELDLIDNVPPIQYAIRLLVPAGSLLLELPDTREWLGPFEAEQLCYTWRHPDARVDELQRQVLGIVQAGGRQRPPASRRQIFKEVWNAAALPASSGRQIVNKEEWVGEPHVETSEFLLVAKPIPHLSEPWYC